MTNPALFAGSLIVLALALTGCDDTTSSRSATSTDSSVEVGVVTLTSQSVKLTSELPGRVLASATAEIRPQVDGIVRKQVFKEGSEVKEGDVLYELDAAKFKAAHDAAAAALQGAQAAQAGAQAKFDRTEQLVTSRTASAQSLDDARAELLQAKANVASAQAAVETAQINVDNTVIKAPIPGRIGTSAVSVGSLVTANQTDALATIRQIDPVNVDLVDSSANLLRLRAQAQAGTIGRDEQGPPKVTLVLEDGSTYSETGKLSLAELVVSQTTGSFSLRAVFANPHRILRPGMFVRATVAIGSTPGAFLVPQRAVTRNEAGKATAYFVTDDNKAKMRILTAGRAVGNDWLVTAGVADGDRLIVDGLQMISDGKAVTPVDVTIDKDGVVKQTIGNPGNADAKAPAKSAPQ
ncbi:efflux RND transporter periplasmic adaptor subunit [Mesorhizobium sp. A556]